MSVIYRVQDRSGRGPWRPGFSSVWSDLELPEHWEQMVPACQKFGIACMNKPRYHVGVGCKSIQKLRCWISKTEYARLLSLEFRAVKMAVDGIAAEDDFQCVFFRSLPLRRNVRKVHLYNLKANQCETSTS